MKAERLMNTKAAVSLPFRLLDGLFAGNYTNVFRFAEPYVCPALLFFAASQLMRRRKTA